MSFRHYLLVLGFFGFNVGFRLLRNHLSNYRKLSPSHGRLKVTQSSNFKESLLKSSWVKFIAGASNQDLSSIRNLCLIYSIAGVDCIDVSADPAVVTAAREGINKALELSPNASSPLLMISVNDDKDPHFRKAYFDPSICPPNCSRPCEVVCPAVAIKTSGVVNERCYGCGRCVPVCPYGYISTQDYAVSYEVIQSLFSSGQVDAIEIHTQPDRVGAFSELWSKIADSVIDHAKVVAVSFPDMQASTVDYLMQLNEVIAGESRECSREFDGIQIWQCDGRPMSGDIGRGTAHRAAEFASRVLGRFEELPPSTSRIRLALGTRHFLQLAGGTNDFSVVTAKENKLFDHGGFGGFAFGGYARKEINQVLIALEESDKIVKIEEHAAEFEYCKVFAKRLVDGVKRR